MTRDEVLAQIQRLGDAAVEAARARGAVHAVFLRIDASNGGADARPLWSFQVRLAEHDPVYVSVWAEPPAAPSALLAKLPELLALAMRGPPFAGVALPKVPEPAPAVAE